MKIFLIGIQRPIHSVLTKKNMDMKENTKNMGEKTQRLLSNKQTNNAGDLKELSKRQ